MTRCHAGGFRGTRLKNLMGGGAVPNFKKLDPKDRVQSINHCADTYKVTIAVENIRDFWERNLRFKTDVSDDDPQKGAPAPG